jgi:hypothetical protein
MPSPSSDEIDPRRVRAGLVLLTVVVLGALAIAVLVHQAIVQVLMVGIALFTVGRTYLLFRSTRR